MIDWVYGLAGGLLIGGAAALFLLVNGRVMGASGILGGLVDGSGRSNGSEKLAFIAGLIAVPAVLAALWAVFCRVAQGRSPADWAACWPSLSFGYS